MTIDPQIDCPVDPSGGECDGNDPHRFMTLAPNPVERETTLTYELTDESSVNVEVLYQETGESFTLVNKQQKAGQYKHSIDAGKLKKKGTYTIILWLNGELKESLRLVNP